MTRDEEIKQASREFGLWKAGEAIFQLGAEWADKHPKEGLVDINKACEWLRTNYEDIGIRYIRGYKAEDEIESFKKAMEE